MIPSFKALAKFGRSLIPAPFIDARRDLIQAKRLAQDFAMLGLGRPSVFRGLLLQPRNNPVIEVPDMQAGHFDLHHIMRRR